jgi:diguanylate cyclase (GGDEF)-like protein
MDDILHLLICSIYQREFETIIQAEAYKNINLHTFPQACSHPQLCRRAAEKIRQAGERYNDQTLLVCECFALPKTEELGLKPSQVRHLDQCFYMLTNRQLLDHYMEQGAYLMTPGWLDDWRAQLKHWGFNQNTGRIFFQESTRKLVLLDTGVNSRSQALLQEMGTYLEMPVESIPIGTDHLQLYLSQIVAEWQHENNHVHTQAEIAEINRKSADYAMAFDLLTNLAQIKNEAEAVETILDLFTMLFSPGSISYCPVVENEFGVSTECQQDEGGRELMQHWALENSEDYRWTSSGAGFFLRFRFQSETMGVLKVEDIKLPQYKYQYLNLALSIAHLCALSISNARTYQRMQLAEITARWEKEISETLRGILSELTLQRDLDQLLERILTSFARVTPYSYAAISLLNGAELIFMAGHRFSADGTPIAFPPPAVPLSIGPIQARDQESLIDLLRSSSMIQDYLGGEKLLSWVNVPLMLRGALIGFLSIGNQFAKVYSESERALAQSFADEVSIAIENARLFKEIQTLAITDGLTGLYNRRHFYHLANLEFRRSRRYNRPLSLLMMDVDLFKRINDTYGHLIGDKVLENTAQKCLQKGRSGDIAGRYGGEEFTLLLPETDEAGALVLAERLRLSVAETPLITEQGSVHITISIGVAATDDTCENLEELLRRSDEALYTAKHSGRNCVKLWIKEAG